MDFFRRLPNVVVYDVEQYAREHSLDPREFETFLLRLVNEAARIVERQTRDAVREERDW